MSLPGISPAGHEGYMRKAIAEAERAAQAGEVPVGAVIVCDGRIVGKAHNQVEMLHDPTAHAEMIAITQAAEYQGDWRLEGMMLYVTIEPCAMCAGAAVLARLEHVIYGASDPRAGAAGSALNVFDANSRIYRVKVRGGLLAEECSALLKEFFARRR
jgi:tRNA(adenine34) deaminase